MVANKVPCHLKGTQGPGCNFLEDFNFTNNFNKFGFGPFCHPTIPCKNDEMNYIPIDESFTTRVILVRANGILWWTLERFEAIPYNVLVEFGDGSTLFVSKME